MTTRYADVHKNPQGPGDARPTAIQVVRDEGLEGQLADHSILVTGASSGIGVETAKALFATGATLFLTARNLDKAKQALGNLVQSPRVHLLALDLESLASVRACATQLLSLTTTLNVYIANAGVMATPEGRTKDGFETQIGTNYFGHFLLFLLLRPALLAAASQQVNSRVVLLSSIAHRYSEVMFDNINLEGEYEKWKAYGQSKTALLWAANEIDRRYTPQGLRAFSVQPGGIQTGLLQFMSEEEKSGLTSDPTLGPQFKSPEQGAATSVWGAIAKSLEGTGGKYLEDVQIAKAYDASEGQWAPGYFPHAYSPEKEKKLYEMSLRLVGEDE
ncbi:putative short-chain dehydrogenase/reductase [Aspergillus uvarum CBS 121591]|uniref:Putative short-chain dehydrogenase/reductase n=1 Tax=Aspergillus uvarum CBS 121591 TaxID=1448315 RepID=A0A319CG02_9EURO|nr:putative short-chain dehydrogenase/reductase [Aspergillus uvarum CBS 121591]PYH77493.1 putative short-chain dehydrogenase/reductase [Aspergillus uvarum CBS 121591]